MSDGPLRVLIVDDEQIGRQRLRRLLGAMPDVAVVGEHDSGEALLAHPLGDVDAVLLDVQMPGLSGVEALQLLPVDAPYVVFCTAHDEHALAAFDAGAIDYVLKPIDPQRLILALARARRVRRGPAEPGVRTPPLRRLALERARGIVLVDPDDVSHLVLDGELVTVHTRIGTFLSELPLGELHARVPADRFERVHRRAIVNLAYVDRLEPIETGGYTARMKGGALVEISRQAARGLRRRLGLR